MFRELSFVLTFIRDFINGNSLIEKYQQLSAHYAGISQEANAGSVPEIEKTIEDLQQEIFNIHKSVNFTIWTTPKLSLLEYMKAKSLIGQDAIDNLNKIFNTIYGNPSKIAAEISTFQNLTSELLTRANQSLTSLGLEGYEEEIAPNNQILEISFEDKAVLKNFWEMKDRANEWSYIIRIFTRLTSQDYESVSIISQASGSPTLGMAISLVKQTAMAIIAAGEKAILLKNIWDTFLQKRKKIEGIGLPKQTTLKMVIKDLEDERDGEYKKKLGEFSLEITKTYGAKEKMNNDKHEIENAVNIALSKITDMLREGVKIIDPNEITAATNDVVPILGSAYKENQALSNEVKLLTAEESQKRLTARHKLMMEDIKVKGINEKPTQEAVKPTFQGKDRPKKTTKNPERKEESPKKNSKKIVQSKVEKPKE